MIITDDSLVNSLAAGMTAAEKAQLERNLAHPEAMDRDTFLALQKVDEGMDLAVARGEDCAPGFDERRREIATLIEAAPWVMHPDHGCIHPTEVEELDLVGDMEAGA